MLNSDVMICERARTGNYGEDLGGEELQLICPMCGSSNPDKLYYESGNDIVGCSDCITEVMLEKAYDMFPELIEERN